MTALASVLKTCRVCECQTVSQREQLVTDPVGPDNDHALAEALTDAARDELLVVAAWGAHADPARAQAVADLADTRGVRLHALGTTIAGAPMHPARLPYSSELTRWSAP